MECIFRQKILVPKSVERLSTIKLENLFLSPQYFRGSTFGTVYFERCPNIHANVHLTLPPALAVGSVNLPLLSIIVMTSPFLAYYLESIDRSFFLNFCIVFSIHTVLISGTCGDFEADEFISKFLLILLGLFFYLWHLSESLTPEQFLTIFSLFNAFLADLLKFAAQVFIKLWPFGIISFILCEIL